MPARKILIADDDRQVLRLVSICLRKEGYDVVAAVDGYQALQFALDQRPDLLILDINMPAGDGMSVQERLRNNAAMCVTPVIYLTGDRQERITTNAKKQGGFAVLHKPFETVQLMQTVRAALGESVAVPTAVG